MKTKNWATDTVSKMNEEEVRFWLKRLRGESTQPYRLTPIERMIDEATGYSVRHPKKANPKRIK